MHFWRPAFPSIGMMFSSLLYVHFLPNQTKLTKFLKNYTNPTHTYQKKAKLFNGAKIYASIIGQFKVSNIY